jgi:hypothetical protein
VRAVIAQSVWRWAMGWTIGVLGFDSRRGLGMFLFTTASRTALEPSQSPIQWVTGVLSLGVKRPGREADHSPPSSTEVTEWVELYLHSPNTPPWRGAQLKHRDNFIFTLTVPCETTIIKNSYFICKVRILNECFQIQITVSWISMGFRKLRGTPRSPRRIDAFEPTVGELTLERSQNILTSDALLPFLWPVTDADWLRYWKLSPETAL